MKNNSNTRTFAEAMGQAMAFGISIVTCDVFNLTTQDTVALKCVG